MSSANMLPSFQATFGDSASASAESHKSTPANSCSQAASGSGGGSTAPGASAVRASCIPSAALAHTSTSPAIPVATGVGIGGTSAAVSASMAATAAPELAPLPLAKHGLAVDGTAYLSGKGRGGTERSGSLFAGLFPAGSGDLAAVLEDSTHPSPSQPSGAAVGVDVGNGPGCSGNAPFDLNHSYQSSAVARSSLPNAVLRGGLAGPTASDFSALWQSTSPLRSIEVPPPAPSVPTQAQTQQAQAPSTPQPQPPSATHNQLVLGASSPSLQSPSVSISAPLPLPSPPHAASPVQNQVAIPAPQPPPQAASTLSASPPDLNQVPSAAHVNAQQAQAQPQAASCVLASNVHRARTSGPHATLAQHQEHGGPHTLGHGHAHSVHAQVVQEQARAQAHNIAASQALHLQSQAAGANMLGLGKNSSVYSYVMASGMFDYGIGSLHGTNKSAAAATNMLQYHAQTAPVVQPMGAPVGNSAANTLFPNHGHAVAVAAAAAYAAQPNAISSAEMSPPPQSHAFANPVALNALPPALLVKQEPVPASASLRTATNHHPLPQHTPSPPPPPPPPPSSLWPTGGAAPQPGTPSPDVPVADIPPGVSVGVGGGATASASAGHGAASSIGDGSEAGGSAAAVARKSRKRPRAVGDEAEDELKEQCPLCPARLRTRVILQNHMRVVHKSGSEHKCPECKAEFPWKSTLDNHVRLVHRRERPFKCPHCEKAFRWSSHLEEHIWVTHEGRKPFKCHVCGKAFGRKNNMQKHCRKVHKLDPNKR